MKRKSPSLDGVAAAMRQRELGILSNQATQRRLQFPEAFVRKLCLEDILRGHLGCVNRLAWNVEGTMLASGSDDRQILLWNYPRAQQLPICVETLHQANIFGVAILPETNNGCVASGAMDHSIQLHHLEHDPLKSRGNSQTQTVRSTPEHWYHSNDGPPLKVRTIPAFSTVYNCHTGRVKTIDIEPGNPNLIWSASEDGMVRQIDRRCQDQGSFTSPNVLLSARQKTRSLSLLAAKINRARPHQIGVAANDQFVRIYDRRMLSPRTPSDFITNRGAAPMLKVAPPHMCLRNPRRNSTSHNTFVAFSSRGDKVLANYHSDHCYSFDITSAADNALTAAFPSASTEPACEQFSQPFLSRKGTLPAQAPNAHIRGTDGRASELSSRAQAAKNAGNRAFFDTDDTAAIHHYTEAIHLAPSCALLYSSRSAAYLKRGWIADSWAAVQDAETAISLDPLLIKAHCRRILGLVALGQLQAAKLAADAFAFQFPNSTEDIERVRHSIAEEEEQRRTVSEHSANVRAQQNERNARAEAQAREVPPNRDFLLLEGAESARDAPESGDDEAEDVLEIGIDEATSGSEDSKPDWDSREGWLWEEQHQIRSSTDGATAQQEGHCYGSRTVAGNPHRTLQRYMGHSNVQTDIKEANFLGGNDEMVAACSDDGHVFIYDAESGCPIQALKADEDVVNCAQPHPYLPLLATSGIESVVKLWAPGESMDSHRLRSPLSSLISYNQERLKSQTSLFSSVTPRVMAALSRNSDLLHVLMAVHRDRGGGHGNEPEVEATAPAPQQHEVSCRVT